MGWFLRGTGREETRERSSEAGREVQKLAMVACEARRIASPLYKY